MAYKNAASWKFPFLFMFFKKRCGHTWETEKSPKQKQTKIKTFAVIKYDFELFAKHFF